MAFIAEIFTMAFITEIFTMAFITEIFTMAFITEIWSGMLRRPKRCATRYLTFQDPLGPLQSTSDWGNLSTLGGSKRPPASGKPIRKGGGLRPPPFLIGLPEAGGRFDPQNRPIWAFIFRLPSAQLSFTGTREGFGRQAKSAKGAIRTAPMVLYVTQ